MKKPPLEKTVVNNVLKTIRSRGGFAVKIHGSPLQVGGLPDILCCYRGRFIGLEAKRDEKGKPSPLQEFQLERITAAGGIATVIHSVEQVQDLLDRIDEELGGPSPRNQ